MKTNTGLPGHDGTMPRPLNVTPPGEKPKETEPRVLTKESLDDIRKRLKELKKRA